MIIPVLGNILIKSLPVLDSNGDEIDLLAQTHRRGEVTGVGNEVELPIKVGDIVLLNKSNFFIELGEEKLVHSSAIFAIETSDVEIIE